jgi:hypothetical protein
MGYFDDFPIEISEHVANALYDVFTELAGLEHV